MHSKKRETRGGVERRLIACEESTKETLKRKLIRKLLSSSMLDLTLSAQLWYPRAHEAITQVCSVAGMKHASESSQQAPQQIASLNLFE
jgi:hypothetical protein